MDITNQYCRLRKPFTYVCVKRLWTDNGSFFANNDCLRSHEHMCTVYRICQQFNWRQTELANASSPHDVVFYEPSRTQELSYRLVAKNSQQNPFWPTSYHAFQQNFVSNRVLLYNDCCIMIGATPNLSRFYWANMFELPFMFAMLNNSANPILYAYTMWNSLCRVWK